MLGITPRTLRLWEDMGLIDHPQRTDTGTRLYGGEDLVLLKFILKLKVLGLTLKEIQELTQRYGENEDLGTVMSKVHDLLNHHLKAVRSQIVSLTELEKELDVYRRKIIAISQA